MMLIRSTVFALALIGGSAQATTLFTTGAPHATDGYCNSNDPLGLCNPGFYEPPTLAWTIYTPFVLHKAATVNGFTYSNVIFDSIGFPYLATNWSIWTASPAATYGSGPAYSGSGTGTTSAGPAINNGFDDTEVTVGGLALQLDAGHYFIGLNNLIPPGDFSFYVSAIGDGHSQTGDQAGNFYDTSLPNQALKITGSVPEPADWALLLGGFSLIGVAARRHRLALLHA